MTVKVLVKSPISTFTGYGRDGIGLIQALVRCGADVYLQPTHVSPPLPDDVISLFSKNLQKPFDLVIDHEDPGQLAIPSALRKEGSVTVAWSMWEYTSLSNLMPSQRKTLQSRMRDFDLFLGYDSVTVEGFKPYLTNTDTAILQGGYDPSEWQPLERDWFGDRFGFMMCGQLHERKDPFVAIQAFVDLKKRYPKEFDGAELHLKNTLRNLHPAMEDWCPKLRVHYATWPTDVLNAFYQSQHVLLAPSRGEGKNLPALEFMTTGGTVIATDWGGHREWLDPQWAYPLDYVLREESAEYPDCKSARASTEHMKELMMHTYKNRAEVKAKADLAAQMIPKMCNWDTVVEKMFYRIRDNVPGKGEEVYTRYQMGLRDSTIGER